MIDLPTISIVIPTRDRAEDLTNLLKDIVKQTFLPIEVVIVDDSPLSSAENVASLFSPQFKSINQYSNNRTNKNKLHAHKARS